MKLTILQILRVLQWAGGLGSHPDGSGRISVRKPPEIKQLLPAHSDFTLLFPLLAVFFLLFTLPFPSLLLCRCQLPFCGTRMIPVQDTSNKPALLHVKHWTNHLLRFKMSNLCRQADGSEENRRKCVFRTLISWPEKSYFNSSSFQQVEALTVETLRDIISL